MPGSAGALAQRKVAALVAGMVAGADSFEDVSVLRHGAMTPVLAGVEQIAWIDVEDTIKAMHGDAQQGAAYGYSKVKGLNAQLAVLSTPLAAPVIAGVPLRKGDVASAHGAPRLIADAVATACRCGAGAMLTVRADSACYQRPVVAAARFSITARSNPQITKAITGIDPDTWTAITYPQAVFDELAGGWVPDAAGAGRGEPFDTYRYHAVFTDSAETMLDAEAHHRDHAIVEQVIADLKNGPPAHLPSGVFTADAAWTTLATIAFNLTRVAATLAGRAHAAATTATTRRRWPQERPRSGQAGHTGELLAPLRPSRHQRPTPAPHESTPTYGSGLVSPRRPSAGRSTRPHPRWCRPSARVRG